MICKRSVILYVQIETQAFEYFWSHFLILFYLNVEKDPFIDGVEPFYKPDEPEKARCFCPDRMTAEEKRLFPHFERSAATNFRNPVILLFQYTHFACRKVVILWLKQSYLLMISGFYTEKCKLHGSTERKGLKRNFSQSIRSQFLDIHFQQVLAIFWKSLKAVQNYENSPKSLQKFFFKV